MLYNIIGSVNSGKSITALHRVVNSKYNKALYLTSGAEPKSIVERLSSYQSNTNKVIINKITVRRIEYGNITDDHLELILLEAKKDNYECVLIDNINSITCEDGACIISKSVFYDDLRKRIAKFSLDNNIDIILIVGTNTDISTKDLNVDTFEEALKNFSKLELEDNQENILIYKSYNGKKPFTKIYEQRNNIIRNLNISQYFTDKQIV